MRKLHYIGDLSKQDAEILADFSSRASNILEFGMGASTQVLCQSKPAAARFHSLETDPQWIARTRDNLEKLGLHGRCLLLPYARWTERFDPVPQFDLIFVDGVDEERLNFAVEAWMLLEIGGWMLFHDTRREKDFHQALCVVMEHFLEVEEVQVNTRSSNITCVKKKPKEPYVDWNITEKKSRWMAGYDPPPENWVSILKSM